MILTPDQEIILTAFAGSDLKDRFYWTGGTLLAHHYLHHRKSFDLDFFSDTPFTREELTPFLAHVKDALGTQIMEERKIYDRWEFVIPDRDPVLRFEFVHYNHEKVRLSPLTSYRGLQVDSLPDLAANKVMAYLDRNQPKDLLDIYVLLKRRKFTVSKLIAMVNQKFGVRISEFTFWTESTKQLKNLDGLLPYLLLSDPVKQGEYLKDVKYFFLDHGKDFLSTLLE